MYRRGDRERGFHPSPAQSIQGPSLYTEIQKVSVDRGMTEKYQGSDVRKEELSA